MDAKCPHCCTAYDVSAGEIGTKAVCETCHAGLLPCLKSYDICVKSETSWIFSSRMGA